MVSLKKSFGTQISTIYENWQKICSSHFHWKKSGFPVCLSLGYLINCVQVGLTIDADTCRADILKLNKICPKFRTIRHISAHMKFKLLLLLSLQCLVASSLSIMSVLEGE